MFSLEREEYFVKGIKDKNEEIFNEFYLETSPFLRNYFSQKVFLRNGDIDDILQEFYTKVWQRIDQFKETSKLFPWLKRIGLNIIIDRVSRNRYYNNTTSLEAILETGKEFESLSAPPVNDKVCKVLNEIKNCLGEKHLIVFSLMYEKEKSCEEISKSLNIPLGTVLSRSYYLKRKIKRGLNV